MPRPLGIPGNTGITGGISGINNRVPDVVGKPTETTTTAPDAMGSVPAGGQKLEGQLSGGAVQTTGTAPPSALWGDSGPQAMAQEMVDALRQMANAAERGQDVGSLAAKYAARFTGLDDASRAAIDVLWTPEGAGLRADLNAASARLAKAAPNTVFPGSIAPFEKDLIEGMSREQLLADAKDRLSKPRSQWAPKVELSQLDGMSDAGLRQLAVDEIMSSRTRRAATMPLETAVAEAQVKGDAAAVKAAAQAIVALGQQGVSDLGAMTDFYKRLAGA